MKDPSAVQIRQLDFNFPGTPPLFSRLDLNIPIGSTFGILGPNGAGKSTLIKLVLGLIPKPGNSIEIFGKNLLQDRKEILKRTGFLLEAPRLYSHLSGLDNLRVFATYRQIIHQPLGKLLEQVGLSQHANKLVRHYSTGMKQRLAIAIAMLHDPALLILDEPTNGLDPQGIVEIRGLIKGLREKPGRTIIFCSHILSEVQQICDHVGVLHQGSFVFQGPRKQPSANTYWIETDQPKQVAARLKMKDFLVKTVERKEVAVQLGDISQVNAIIDLLRAANLNIFQIKREEKSLEHLYLRVTQEEQKLKSVGVERRHHNDPKVS